MFFRGLWVLLFFHFFDGTMIALSLAAQQETKPGN